MSNEETKELKQCNGDCTMCDEHKEKCDKEATSQKMPNGERVVSFKEEPTIVDVAKILQDDAEFKEATKDAQIVATRILKHQNGMDSVLQVFFHRRVPKKIIVTNELPK